MFCCRRELWLTRRIRRIQRLPVSVTAFYTFALSNYCAAWWVSELVGWLVACLLESLLGTRLPGLIFSSAFRFCLRPITMYFLNFVRIPVRFIPRSAFLFQSMIVGYSFLILFVALLVSCCIVLRTLSADYVHTLRTSLFVSKAEATYTPLLDVGCLFFIWGMMK